MKSPFAVLALALFAGLSGCGQAVPPVQATHEPAEPATHQTAVVETREFPVDEIIAPGKVELNPNRVSKVLMPLAGRVRSVLVKLGDSVTEGQPVAVIESPEAGQALAAYAEAQAQVRQASTALAKAEKDLARVRELNANKAAPLKDVIEAETAVDLARSTLTQMQIAADEALHRLNMLGVDPTHHSHEIRIHAPIAGKVLEVSVAPGELRNDTNQPLMTIADLSTVWITSQVPESSIRLVRINEPLFIELVAYPGEKLYGRVRRIDDSVDPDTRTVKVQAELENRDGRFRPEMFGRIRHSHGTRRLACVPASAVVHGGGAAWVMVERAPGQLEKTRIESLEASGGVIPVLSGVREGDRVVVDGAALLRER